MRKIPHLLLTGFLLISPHSLGAAGKTSAEFLLLPGEARAVGMGEAYCAAAAGVNGLWYNPSTLAKNPYMSSSIMHAMILDGMTFNTIGIAAPLIKQQAVGVGIRYLNVGSIKSYDNTGEAAPAYNPTDVSMQVSYAKTLFGTSLGLSLKYVRSTIDKTATTYSADMGAHYMLGDFSFGAAAENITGALTFKKQADPLPTRVRTGTSWRINRSWMLNSDYFFPLNDEGWLAGGVEYSRAMQDNTGWAVRGGYNTRGGDIDGLSGISAGASIAMNEVIVNYAWVPFGDLGLTHRLSFNFQLQNPWLVKKRGEYFEYGVGSKNAQKMREGLFGLRTPELTEAGLKAMMMPKSPWKKRGFRPRTSTDRVLDDLARDAICPADGPLSVSVKTSGSVSFQAQPELEKSHGLKVGDYLFAGDRLATRKKAFTQLILANGTKLEIGANSQFELSESPSACDRINSKLKTGEIYNVTPEEKEHIVETALGNARFLKSEGHLAVDGKTLTLRIFDGDVVFELNGETISLSAGQTLTNDKKAVEKAPEKKKRRWRKKKEEKPIPKDMAEVKFRSLASKSTTTTSNRYFLLSSTDPEAEKKRKRFPDRKGMDKRIDKFKKMPPPGRWDPGVLAEYKDYIEELESIDGLIVAEYLKEKTLRTDVSNHIFNLKQSREDLTGQVQALTADLQIFSLRKEQIVEEMKTASVIKKKELLLERKQVDFILKRARKSLVKTQKQLRKMISEIRYSESYLAAIPIVRMLNITAKESNIPFKTASAEIAPAAYPTLDRIAEAAKKLRPYTVVIEGHTDKTGSSRVNLRLSKRRAKAVARYLRKKTGMKKKAFRPRGMGSSQPLVEGNSPEALARNRRVEIWFKLKGL